MTVSYTDRFLTCDHNGVTIRWYAFPFGTKNIPWQDLRTATRRTMGPLTGQWRIWGSGDFKHWYHLDPLRTRKSDAFALALRDAFVVPVVTPDDPERFSRALREHGVLVRGAPDAV